MNKVWLMEIEVEWSYFIPYEKPYELIGWDSKIWQVFASDPTDEQVRIALFDWVESGEVKWRCKFDYPHIVQDLMDNGQAENFAVHSDYDYIVKMCCYEKGVVQ